MGEITRQTEFGQMIYQFISSLNDCKNIVEIGGWDGTGTTRCIYDALMEHHQYCDLYSLEINPIRHQQALLNYKEHDSSTQIHLHFLNGTLCGTDDIKAAEEYVTIHRDEFVQQQQQNFQKFYNENIEAIGKAERLLESLPTQIDILVLDGGEYTTYNEWKVLQDYANIKYLILDDTATLKCKYILKELSDKVIAKTSERNGGVIIQL